jgi:hypothetical protein
LRLVLGVSRQGGAAGNGRVYLEVYEYVGIVEYAQHVIPITQLAPLSTDQIRIGNNAIATAVVGMSVGGHVGYSVESIPMVIPGLCVL